VLAIKLGLTLLLGSLSMIIEKWVMGRLGCTYPVDVWLR